MPLSSWQGAAVVHLNRISGKHTSGLSQHLGLKEGGRMMKGGYGTRGENTTCQVTNCSDHLAQKCAVTRVSLGG